MAFQVALEDEDFTRSRVDHSPYIQAITSGKESGKVVAITLPNAEVDKTIGVLRQCASAMGIGLRFDNLKDLGDGTTKVRFRTAEKRKFSPDAIAKRKATMLKNGTKAGRKATSTSGKKAS
jgi:hypothetical protein